nr:immunoglobulin light chain junction region [Macaca mulatta]
DFHCYSADSSGNWVF